MEIVNDDFFFIYVPLFVIAFWIFIGVVIYFDNKV
jgi:hypothetical protein